MNEVYFAGYKLNRENFFLAPKPGWEKGKNLRWIHSLRYKPSENSKGLTFQPELLNEHSNDRLANLADGLSSFSALYKMGDRIISSGCDLVGKNNKLYEAHNQKSEQTTWGEWLDCLSYFYPANRVYTEPLFLSEFDSNDIARGEGWVESGNAKLFAPLQIVKQVDYMLTAHIRDKKDGKNYSQESIEEGNDFFAAFNLAGLNLKMDYLGNTRWKFLVKRKDFCDLSFKLKETVSFALDFYMRLVAVRRNLKSSAICLIENAANLNAEILKNIFPKVQFIVN